MKDKKLILTFSILLSLVFTIFNQSCRLPGMRSNFDLLNINF